MGTPDIVETPWRKTVNWSNVFEERQRLKEEIEHYKPLGDLLTRDVSFPQVNILLFGASGDGKSSVFNTIISVFREKIFNVARCGYGDHTITTKFWRYPIMSGSAAQNKKLKFRICDVRGLETDHLMVKDNMRFVLEGNIPDRFQFDPSGNICSDMPGFNKHPSLHERIHCVAIIQDASVVDAVNDSDVTRNIKEMQTVMNSLDVPQCVILTKIDTISEEIRDDVDKAFCSTRVKGCVGKVSEMLGIPRNQIFPMKNYESETENDPCMDEMALLTLKGILTNCDAYLCNHYETIQGKMGTPDIVETPWRKTVNWSNVFEERQRLKEELEHYKPLGDLLTRDVSFPQVNILLFGASGDGKSSVFNTIISVFREKIFNVARCGYGDHTMTTKFSMYPIMSGSAAQNKKLKFRICDVRGLETDHLMVRDNMRFVLEGNIPDRFQFDPSGNISSDMPGFNKHPSLHERIHCVAIIQDASVVDAVNDSDVTRNIKEMQTVMTSLDVPQCVILTKIDAISEETRDDVEKAFCSTRVKGTVGKVSEMLGIPRNQIFPMKNYESETENDPCIDEMALLTLKGILTNCDAYLCNHYETIQGSYREGER